MIRWVGPKDTRRIQALRPYAPDQQQCAGSRVIDEIFGSEVDNTGLKSSIFNGRKERKRERERESHIVPPCIVDIFS